VFVAVCVCVCVCVPACVCVCVQNISKSKEQILMTCMYLGTNRLTFGENPGSFVDAGWFP